MVRIVILSAVFGAILPPLFAFAFEATSTSFKLIDPVFTVTGGFATSTTYRLNEVVAQPAIATSSSPTNFRVSSGFLYFPFVTKPVVTATAGSGSVALSWTASQGFLGWTVSGYNVGQAIISGGPYTYSASLGNVLSSTRGGLSNGAVYYFVVRAEDAFGNSIATSSEVFATPSAGAVAVLPPQVSTVSDGAGIIKNFLISLVAALHKPLVPCSNGASGDLNCDGKVGLQDLSILLSRSEKVGVQEVSILFSHWTEPLLTFAPEPSRSVLPRSVEKIIVPEKQVASVGEAAGLFETTTAAVSQKEGGQAPSSLVVWVRMITQPLDRAVFLATGLVKALWDVLFSNFLLLFKKQ